MTTRDADGRLREDDDICFGSRCVPTRVRRIPLSLFSVAFAITAVAILTLMSAAPAVQAVTEDYLDDYSFTPSDPIPLTPSVDGVSEYSNESSTPDAPRSIDSLPDLGYGPDTLSFYTEIDPLVTDVLLHCYPEEIAADYTDILAVDNATTEGSPIDNGRDYWNVNSFGRYRFGSEDYSLLTLLDLDSSILASSYFQVNSRNATALGPATVQERSTSVFTTVQDILVDGISVGNLFVRNEFPMNNSPKISAWITSDSQEVFEIVWNTLLPDGYIRTSEGEYLVSNLTGTGLCRADYLVFEFGVMDSQGRWTSSVRVDWSDAGCGNLSFEEHSGGYLARVAFPRGMRDVDPTVVATSECRFATSGSPFRNTVYYNGAYWLFYGAYDGLMYVRSADNGATWSNPLQVPMAMFPERPGMFDVTISNSHIALSGLIRYSLGDDHYSIYFIEGYITGSSIEWNLDTDTIVRSMPDSMFGWFGGVSLGTDGTAYICYAEATGVLFDKIRLVTLLKVPYSTYFVEVSNHFPQYDYPQSSHEIRPFLRPRVFTTSEDSVVFMEFVGIDDPDIPATITVTSPNGGEAWAAGTHHTIAWTSNGAGSYVKIELVKPDTTVVIDASDPNDGAFDWYISPLTATGSTYTIRISDTSNPLTVDDSDAAFTILANSVTIQVASPNGGEAWERGTSHLITWGGTAGGVVKIELYDVSRDSPLTTIVSSAPNIGYYPWSIPSYQALDTDYKVKISVLLTPYFDDSDAVFSIIPISANTITVVAPNGGESWLRGSTQQIKWDSTGLIDTPTSNVKIELLRSGIYYATIDSSEPNDGIFDWTIPSYFDVRDDMSIKITSISSPTVYDSSNSYFALTYNIPSDWIDDSRIYWNIYRPLSGTWEFSSPLQLPLSLSSVDQFSVCSGGVDEMDIACISSTGSLSSS